MKPSLPLAGLMFSLLLGLPFIAASEQELRTMAEAGDATAQNRLGLMYYQGQRLPKNLAEAAKWYRKAADQGLAEAQHNLGVMFAAGEGVLRDPTEAIKWFREAADKGYGPAQNNLGVLYHGERGTQGFGRGRQVVSRGGRPGAGAGAGQPRRDVSDW
jgi:TPR repeat protein